MDPELTENSDADFDAAFADAAAGNPETPPADKPAEGTTPTEGTPAADKPAEGTTPVEGTPPADKPADKPADGTPPAEGTPPADKPVEDTSATPTDELAQMRQRAADAEAALAAERAAKAKPEPEVAKPVEPPPMYTKEEQDTLAKYYEEWPDVAKGEAFVRRAEYARLVDHIWKSLAPTFQELRDLREQVGAHGEVTQLSQLREIVPDYDAVRDPTLAWIAKQPDYLKDAYSKVTSAGSPAEIADLINRFKKDTGWTAPAGAVPAAKPAVPAAKPAAALPGTKTKPTISATAAAAAKGMAPVDNGRTGPTGGEDPNDFDSAWKEAAA